MTQQINLTLSDLILAGSAILVAAFLSICIGVRAMLRHIQEKGHALAQVSGIELNRCARATAASVIINFATFFLVGTTTLALGLGLGKTAVPFMQWLLPDRALGFALLVSYAALFTSLKAIGPELNEALRKLFC